MNKEFHYSVNPLSVEEALEWNMNHTLQEIHDNKLSLRLKTIAGITTEEMPKWLIVEQLGILDNSLHDVYISFPLTCLFTRKGRRRRISRALKMMGVPIIKVKRVTAGLQLAEDGFDVIQISELKSIP